MIILRCISAVYVHVMYNVQHTHTYHILCTGLSDDVRLAPGDGTFRISHSGVRRCCRVILDGIMLIRWVGFG